MGTIVKTITTLIPIGCFIYSLANKPEMETMIFIGALAILFLIIGRYSCEPTRER